MNPAAGGAAAAAVLCIACCGGPALAQSCPAPLAEATRLVLITTPTMRDVQASVRLYDRTSPNDQWRPRGPVEPAVVGKAGLGWSQFFASLARGKEPIKVEGDKRAPAGIYRIGRSFGIVPSSRRDHLQITPDTTCINDPASPAYNTIVSRARIGPRVRGEAMSQALPMYRRGLVLDYPTDGRRKAGSCIFIHVWASSTTGTAGCVALPEPRVEALQNFAEAGAVAAILPRQALGRLAGCIPQE